jgi:hypothetical protein
MNNVIFENVEKGISKGMPKNWIFIRLSVVELNVWMNDYKSANMSIPMDRDLELHCEIGNGKRSEADKIDKAS